MTRTLKETAAELAKQKQQKQPPVSSVMARYSAVQGGHGTFSNPPIQVDSGAGSKRRELEHTLDSLAALIQHVVLTRGGQSAVVRRGSGEGGFITRIILPASGLLMPSGVEEVMNQIRSIVLQNYPAVRVDALDVRSVGLGSPVSAILQLNTGAGLPLKAITTNGTGEDCAANPFVHFINHYWCYRHE